MAEDLFAKKLAVTMRCSDRDERKVYLHFKIEMNHVTDPIQKKELVIRLTDEKDLFFLYTLHLGEEDFQCLKTQQGLLVDFGSFPQKVVELLNLCLLEEDKEVPKFILQLLNQGGVNQIRPIAVLNIVETNPFKHLTHLSLKFLPGQDSDVKKYLADCLKQLKETNELLHQRLEHTNTDLSQRLKQAEEKLSTRTTELESLKTEWTCKINELTANHKEELSLEKEQCFEIKNSCQLKLENERKELEQSHMRIVKQMEAKLFEAESSNKELQDRKYKLESTQRELRSHLNSAEEQLQLGKIEIQNLRKQNVSMDAKLHEQEKLINQQGTRIAVLEQELKDKEQVLAKSSDLLGSEQDQKKRYEEEFELKHREISKLENKVKAISVEVKKGNEIIRKLQSENKNYHAKVKLRSQIASEQEKVISEKDDLIENMQVELKTLKENSSKKEDENEKLKTNLENVTKKLEECNEMLKTNENVIQWLNKQVNEVQLSSSGRTTTFETSHNSTQSTAGSGAFRNHVAMAAPGFLPSNLNPSSRYPTQDVNNIASQVHLTKSQNISSKPQVQYNGIASRRLNIAQPPQNRIISPIAEDCRPPCQPGALIEESSPILASSREPEKDIIHNGHISSKGNEADPHQNPVKSTVGIPPNKNHSVPSLPIPILTSSRLPAHLNINRPIQPPLASSYFPLKTKPS
ncbi:spindle assembly abnormal protein 6 homolog [Octopus sinensis]|uniref:Spindle assembly abnormal protein 6 homolog n=1 Tax=Octopus sinensis TaxID=2607531 RepID=A0A6P7SLI5_9MOLL|nr:spindle assembly abnormal protein 6 homolog [Octopus sinensis]